MSIWYIGNQNSISIKFSLIKTGLIENKYIDLIKINSFNNVKEGVFNWREVNNFSGLRDTHIKNPFQNYFIN